MSNVPPNGSDRLPDLRALRASLAPEGCWLLVEEVMAMLGVSTNPATYKIDRSEWRHLIEDSLQGERGRNFLGSRERLLEAAQAVRLPKTMTA